MFYLILLQNPARNHWCQLLMVLEHIWGKGAHLVYAAAVPAVNWKHWQRQRLSGVV